MTAAPSRHGHPTPATPALLTGKLPQTVTPLHPPFAEAPEAQRPPPHNLRWRGPAITAGAMAAIWAMLLGDQPGSWLLGAPAILGGVALAASVPAAPAGPGQRLRLSPGGALRFAGWFARQSVLGASDVAWRACQPRLPIAPGFRTHVTGLPPGAPRTLLANCITLLPGTLTADIDGARLTIHMLDRTQDLDADLGALEHRVAAIWALPPHRPGHGEARA
ncbi:Na+/H+ antiporter subunit E [Meridianimarinicoccus sp. RP-17]